MPNNPFDNLVDDIRNDLERHMEQIRIANVGNRPIRFENDLIAEANPIPPPIKQEKEDEDFDVIDITGVTRKRSECIVYNGKFYSKDNEDVFECYISGEYLHKNYAYKVVSSLSLKDGKLIKETVFINSRLDYTTVPFTSNKYKINGKAINTEVLISTGLFKESLFYGQFIDIDTVENRNDVCTITHYDSFKNYISKLENLSLKEQFKYGIKSPSYLITEGNKMTFGIELEIARGFIPIYRSKDFNVLAVRDGSLNAGNGGLEVVTGVLTGDTGFKHLQDISNYLSKRCLVDKYCGMHLHLGNINFSNKFLVNSYKLALILENQIFSILPPSRRNNAYCRRLKKFKFDTVLDSRSLKAQEDYNTLFKYISYESTNNPNFEYNKTKQHPLGAKCGYNHDTPRYCWVNYVPAMFNTRGNFSYSIEIRNHQGSLNFTKIKNWTLLFMGIFSFVDKYPELIREDITLEDIIIKMYPKTGGKLIKYIQDRREKFNTDDFKENIEYVKEFEVEEKNLTIKELI